MYEIVTPPAAGALQDDDIRMLTAQLRIDVSDEEWPIVEHYAAAALEYFRFEFGVAILPQTLIARFPSFKVPFFLAASPIRDVTGITYLTSADVADVAATGWYWSKTGRHVTVRPGAAGWPTDVNCYHPSPVSVQFEVGYTAEMPKAVKQAQLMLVDYWYNNRSDVTDAQSARFLVPHGVQALLATHRAAYAF